MTVKTSDVPCPDCEAPLQVIYQTDLEQVVAGWACPECGFVQSESPNFRASVSVAEDEEYVLRKEQPLTSDDVSDPLNTVVDEFRARASREMETDEVWMLVDPETGEVVDSLRGRKVVRDRRAEAAADDE